MVRGAPVRACNGRVVTQPMPKTFETLLTAKAFCRDNDRHENAAGRKMGAFTAAQQSPAVKQKFANVVVHL